MQRVGVKSGERWMFQDVHQGGPAYSAGIRPGDPERSGQEQVLTSSFAWESASLRLEIIPRPTAVTPIDSVLKQKSQAVAREDEVENDFQEKCTKGAKFAAQAAFSAILGEISCLFSLVLEFFTRFRGGSFQPLTHLSGNQSSGNSPVADD